MGPWPKMKQLPCLFTHLHYIGGEECKRVVTIATLGRCGMMKGTVSKRNIALFSGYEQPDDYIL